MESGRTKLLLLPQEIYGESGRERKKNGRKEGEIAREWRGAEDGDGGALWVSAN